MIETFDLSNPDKPTIKKDPQATLDYSERWTDWLAAVSDNIASATVTCPDAALTIAAPVLVGGVVSAMIGGGTLDATHAVVFTIVTTGGRTDQRTIYLKIRNR